MNLLRKEFLDVFYNANRIYLWNTQSDSDNKYWSFSFFKLLDIIIATKLEKIRIHAIPINKQHSWLAYLWNQSSASLIKKYNEQYFNIQYFGDYGHHDICITQKIEDLETLHQ